MKSLIIYSHPWEGSFNKSVFDFTISKLSEKGNEIDIIDLYKDGFNPVMTNDDLRLFGKGEYNDSLAHDYVNRMKACDEIIFIYPIWWYGEPAILKGFFDKVLLKGHAYGEVNRKLHGLLDIKKAIIMTTANIDRDTFISLGNPIENVMIKGILKEVGIENVKWIHCAKVHLEEARNKYFKEIAENIN